jgi:hypothetical protein
VNPYFTNDTHVYGVTLQLCDEGSIPLEEYHTVSMSHEAAKAFFEAAKVTLEGYR